MAIQNIYDHPQFFDGYAALRDTNSGLNQAIEEPALWRALPPSLEGLSILDLGCGFGDFARKARAAGARRVLAVDVSSRMLAAARQRTADTAVEYRQAAIEEFDASGEWFDVVVSSLALHYVDDYRAAMRRIAGCMKPGARLAFSVEHPICTALPEQQWCAGPDGEPRHWPVDQYSQEGARHTRWFIDGVVKYHRQVQTYVNGVLDAGFRLVRLEEPVPSGEALAAVPKFHLHCRRPSLLVIAADR